MSLLVLEMRFLGGPQDFNEVKQEISWRTEKNLEYTIQVAQEYSDTAEKLKDSDLQTETLEEAIERMAQKAKDKIIKEFDEATVWLKKYGGRVKSVLELDERQESLLVAFIEKSNSYILTAVTRFCSYIIDTLRQMYEGTVAVIEGTKLVVKKTKDFVASLISAIRNYFQYSIGSTGTLA
ncbi:hypothetical protein BDV27DRAFT_91565 [Aspergillus caelatus]|uniref:Uncharacterized protein n=1 Tax=Aspergillus caelatus TaxID=61420 RepID=A0A5N7A9V1_9EURO|nr:uncharacterized protein BDV27DRAFT_91565 [Aspergillus caelatus]KAE8366413.1 hypothetical protein BDV27DRAFT_91565 [Aspergillus caelatus]